MSLRSRTERGRRVLADGPAADRTGARVAAAVAKYAAPRPVAEAPDADLVNYAPLAANFADAGRTYPVHTAKAAWASAAFYHAGGSFDPLVADRIKEACHHHGIGGEWDRLEKVARPAAGPGPTRFALPESRRYPLDTPDRVKAAAAYFAEYADRLGPEDRREFARNAALAAAEHPGLLPNSDLSRLEAEGGLGRTAPGWKRAFDDRVRLAEREGQADLAAALKEASAGPPADAAVAASLLRAVDSANRWRLDDPLSVLVDTTPCLAAAKVAAVARAADGSWYRRADLTAVPDEAVAALFGAPPVVSGAYRERLLTDPEKSAAFREVLTDHGVSPVEGPPRRRPDWAALAALADPGTGSGQ